ncbi:hypothetical protein DPMN_131198, partial [Dreissena polymorpha]
WEHAGYANTSFTDGTSLTENNKRHAREKKKAFANSVDPDETPHDAASHQGLRCLLKEISIIPLRLVLSLVLGKLDLMHGSCPLLREDFSLKDSMITVNWVMRVVYRVIS